MVSQLRRYIPGHPEVGVLVDGAGYEAPQVLALPKDMGEAVGEAGGRLHGWERDFADVVRLSQPKD